MIFCDPEPVEEGEWGMAKRGVSQQ